MGTPRWLDDEQQRAWRRLVAVTMLLPPALDTQLQRDAELTHFSYLVLAMLSETPGRALRMSELATRANSSQSRLSHVVSRLEERGWVTRQRSDDDARGYLAILTDSGFDKVVATAPGHVEAVQSYIFDVLSPEQVRHLEQIAAAVLTRLDPEGKLRLRLDG